MLSPLPPDPYAALGVPKDADLAQIRTAHRKLVLKFHPDRIKGDDAEEKDKAKDKFQNAQQAYELLSDPGRRTRYDNQVKLAELQRDRMMARETERAFQPQSRSTAPGPTTVKREVRDDGKIYEERVPDYFDQRDSYDDPLPRSSSARKHEAPYEKERKSSAPKPAEKKEKSGHREGSPINISFRTAAGLKAAASRARERDRTKESHAKNQKVRDEEKRRDRSEKHFAKGSVHVESHSESESDRDTVTPRYNSRSRRSSPPRRPEPESGRGRPTPSRRDAYRHEDDPISDGEKWEQHYHNTVNYLAESQKRPTVSRNESSKYVYWEGDNGDRKSGSDSEKRSSRRTKPDDSRSRPSMPAYSSDPTYLRPHMEERSPYKERDRERERSRTTPYPSDRERTAPPNLPRANTMPTNKSSRKDNAPAKPSNLKHSETQGDSGYYSSSSPHTPEMKGESPPPSRENSKKKNNTTSYRVLAHDSDDDSRVSRIQILTPDDPKYSRRYRSPTPERRKDRDQRYPSERPQPKDRPVRMDSNSRSQSYRGPMPTSLPRDEFRQEIPGARRSPPVRQGSGKLYGEITPDDKDNTKSYPYDASHVKTSSYQKPQFTSHGSRHHRDGEDDYAAPSSYKDPVRSAYGRRPSYVY